MAGIQACFSRKKSGDYTTRDHPSEDRKRTLPVVSGLWSVDVLSAS